ncbi:hypothetical protein [Bdellovibrio sp. BCCA]|uniref:hypothetical protein n=1 Tax=Bdellovibrio sp. BCCA TaxID=3136281 RepID=UPI0030EFB9DA
MKLIYIDPHCSGLQVTNCPSKDKVEQVLSSKGMNEDECGGEVVHYVFIDSKGNETKGSLDFT